MLIAVKGQENPAHMTSSDKVNEFNFNVQDFSFSVRVYDMIHSSIGLPKLCSKCFLLVIIKLKGTTLKQNNNGPQHSYPELLQATTTTHPSPHQLCITKKQVPQPEINADP